MWGAIWGGLCWSSAQAAAPGPILPSFEAPDAPALYAEQKGEPLACREWVTGELLLCFKVELGVGTGYVRRHVTAGDLERWAVSLSDLEAAATGALAESPWIKQAVEGGGGDWWIAQAPAGREAVALLHPEWLGAIGPQPVVGVPEPGTVVAWRPDGGELDQIMAVAIRRAWEAADHPISPGGFQWTGGAWLAWGEAVPATAAPAEQSAPSGDRRREMIE